jgi:hypothetical protein
MQWSAYKPSYVTAESNREIMVHASQRSNSAIRFPAVSQIGHHNMFQSFVAQLQEYAPSIWTANSRVEAVHDRSARRQLQTQAQPIGSDMSIELKNVFNPDERKVWIHKFWRFVAMYCSAPSHLS